MRRRLVLAIVAVAAAAVVLFAVPLALELRSSYRDQELARLQRDTLAATRQIDVSGTPRGDAIELPRSPDVVGVYAPAGRRLAGRGPGSADSLVRAAGASGRASQRASSGRLIVALPLLRNERLTGVVRATRGDEKVAERTRRAWLALTALAAGLIAAASLAAVVLGRRLARPLEHVATSARRLGDGDFAVRSSACGVAEVDAVSEALNTTARRLESLVDRERAFSADASHQLRTPLAALRLELEAMELSARSTPKLTAQSTPELTAALGQVDRLQSTIDTLLSVARDSPRSSSGTNLEELLSATEEQWRARLATQSRPLHTLTRTGHHTAAASSRVVSEILDVLVSNADRHGRGPVTLTLRDVEGWLAIDVADQGPGFPADPEDAFARRSDAADGHGIGLALARSLAHAEGGRISVGTPGPHPVVTLLLPRAPGA